MSPTPPHSAIGVFLAFLRLGLTSFGGPVAHLGFFRTDLVERRRWLDEATYTDVVALCQFLPGPASSQVGIAIGLLRAGLPGAVAAWIGFTLPSALLMMLFGLGLDAVGDVGHARWLHGLKVVAVAVVAQAVWGMAKTLCPDRSRASIAVAAALLALAVPSAPGQMGAIAIGALIGWRWLPGGAEGQGASFAVPIARGWSVGALVLFFGLLGGLPLAAAFTSNHALHLADSFFRSGSLVFGGGHVVLPLLQAEVVRSGWMANDVFLAGYGAAQALPGPLFTFAAYLGTVMTEAPSGWRGGLLCLAAIFLPSFLLVVGVLPWWEGLRRREGVRKALNGVNAAVVGLLLAALYSPVWTSAIARPLDFALALLSFLLLALWRVPPWLVVALGAAAGAALS